MSESQSKRIEITFGDGHKAFRFHSPNSLEQQLRVSFRIPSASPIELMDETNAVVPLMELEDGKEYVLHRVVGEDWSTRPLWQTKDPIHGLICLPDICLRFIDTREFQRLRDLHQTGSCHMVYIGSHHTRFDHSVGVAHLAFRMVSSISERQPELGITSRDILCVTLAALCHDIGHGPGSHMWDGQILSRLEIDMTHEDMSLLMIDVIIARIKSHSELLREIDDPFDGLTDEDFLFIKAMIHPPSGAYTIENVGRPTSKHFLMDIVSNKSSGLDVDKFDYIQRDTYNTGVRGVFDVDRLIGNVVVKECEGVLQMCWPQKELEGIIEIFHTRDSLHRRVYQHRTNISIESMFRDAVILAAPCVEIRNDKGEWLSFSEAQKDVSSFVKISDWFFRYLQFGKDFRINWDDPRMQQSASLLESIQTRKIWKFVGTLFAKIDNHNQAKQELEKFSGGYITCDEWEMKTAMFSWGKGDRNPLENVAFIKKSNDEPMKPKPEELSRVFVPASFREHVLYVFVKSQDPQVRDLARAAFAQWCQEKGIESSLVDMSSVALSRRARRRASATAPTTPNRMSPVRRIIQKPTSPGII
jgi:deoxynucleoside triphosphate triphosphohydrolase SAMHD1